MRAAPMQRHRRSDCRAAPCTGAWRSWGSARMSDGRPAQIPTEGFARPVTTRRKVKWPFERRISVLTIALAVPATVLGVALLALLELSPILRACLIIMLV